ncbi:hypothetical protein KP509_32G066900 [Ceratopteris richardii]|nr:hypothetical protein KP509_32G066900 [Ceratopteris richardii]
MVQSHSSSSFGSSSFTLSSSSSSFASSQSSTPWPKSFSDPSADDAHINGNSLCYVYPCAPVALTRTIMVVLVLMIPLVLPPLPPPPTLFMLFPMAIMVFLFCTAYRLRGTARR